MRHWKKLSATGLKMYEIKDCHLKKPQTNKTQKIPSKQTNYNQKKKGKKNNVNFIILYYIIFIQ